jgi:hypothetical protein
LDSFFEEAFFVRLHAVVSISVFPGLVSLAVLVGDKHFMENLDWATSGDEEQETGLKLAHMQCELIHLKEQLQTSGKEKTVLKQDLINAASERRVLNQVCSLSWEGIVLLTDCHIEF